MGKLPKFDIVRDIKTTEDGGFFCEGCLVGKDRAVVSPDPRYCQDCYDVLREAMKTDMRWGHSPSMPKVMEGGTGGVGATAAKSDY